MVCDNILIYYLYDKLENNSDQLSSFFTNALKNTTFSLHWLFEIIIFVW